MEAPLCFERTRTVEPRLFVQDTCQLGEGCFWHGDRLWWVDIDGCTLNSVDGSGQDRRTYPIGQRIGVAMPLPGGKFITGLEEGIGIFDPATGGIEILHRPESGLEGSRFNDGKCDPAGRFLAGTLRMIKQPKTSSLYSLNEFGSLSKLYAPVTTSNGLAWSADGKTMYYIDTPTFEIAAFPYDVRTGEIGPRSVAVKIPQSASYPDGMCIDAAGNLWVCHWGGSAVRCWSPVTGECLVEISMPCRQPTCPCFGGPGYSQLFITSARGGDDPEAHPLAGSVFVCEPGATGLPVQVCTLRR